MEASAERKEYLGHMPHLTNEEYHAAPGISKSQLDAIADKSALHFWAEYLDPERVRKETEALDAGQAIHTAILEPDMLLDRVACEPECDRRTKIGKEIAAAFELENAGKLILKNEVYLSVLAIRDAAHRHPVASGLLTRGKAEQSYFAHDPETGELIKCRADYIHDDGSMIVDVKSAVDASPWAFGKAAANFRYDLQAAWYPDVVSLVTGERPQHFVWVAFEKSHPYAIGVYYATSEMIERARITARRDMMKIIHHKRTDTWPDYGADILQLQLPVWAKR
jgi:exodeoxyribonuclease VIII